MLLPPEVGVVAPSGGSMFNNRAPFAAGMLGPIGHNLLAPQTVGVLVPSRGNTSLPLGAGAFVPGGGKTLTPRTGNMLLPPGAGMPTRLRSRGDCNGSSLKEGNMLARPSWRQCSPPSHKTSEQKQQSKMQAQSRKYALRQTYTCFLRSKLLVTTRHVDARVPTYYSSSQPAALGDCGTPVLNCPRSRLANPLAQHRRR